MASGLQMTAHGSTVALRSLSFPPHSISHARPLRVGVKGRLRNEPTVIRIEAFHEAGRSFGRLKNDLVAAFKACSLQVPFVEGVSRMRLMETVSLPLRLTRIAIGGFLDFLHMAAAGLFGFNENFFKDLRTYFGDAIFSRMASSLEKFMLAYLTAPSGALPGIRYCLLHRIGAIGLAGVSLFTVGLTLSLVSSAVENASVNCSKATDKSSAGEVENVLTFILRGLYNVLFSKLSYQVLDGMKQQILKPLLCKYPLASSIILFGVLVGKAFLLPLMGLKTNKQHKAPSNGDSPLFKLDLSFFWRGLKFKLKLSADSEGFTKF